MAKPQEGGTGERWAPTLFLTTLPDDILRNVLRLLEPRAIGAVACCSRRLASLAGEDALWCDLVQSQLPHVAALLQQAQPDWWAGTSWRQRLRALVGGAAFQAQVHNREPENEAEDFLLSAYDAAVWLPPASARALLHGGTEGASSTCTAGNNSSSIRSRGAAGGATDAASYPASTSEQQQRVLFSARYLPMGQMKAVEEPGVVATRLRLPPRGSRPYAVYGGVGGAASTVGLTVGEEVEVQWKGRRCHPYGWWFGTVQSVRGNRVVLLFRQYPRSSVWHRVRAPIKPGAEAAVNGDWSFGYVGGLRRLTDAEREEWRRHGAPHPPAPAVLQALAEEAAEEEWSDDEELDIDLDLAAELEEEEEALLLPPAGEDAPAAAAAEAMAVAPGADAAGAAGAAAGDAAAGGPAAPPVEPIAMQLGAAATAAAAAAEGWPVELAEMLAAAAEPHS
ncbi:hypothetical protein ABPG77_005797 [Micractinium sp. CCAP 211/92]